MAMKPGNGGGENGERDPRLDLLYRDAPRETPPPHLDAAILAAARREVRARPRPLSTQLRRWRLPVSIAAVVVLSVTLVTLLGEESRDPLMAELRSTAETPVARSVEPQVQPTEPAKPAEDRQRAPVAVSEPFSSRRDEGAAKALPEARMMEKRAQSDAGPAATQGTPATTVPEADSRISPGLLRDTPGAAGGRPAGQFAAPDERREQPPAGAAQRSSPERVAPAAPRSKPVLRGMQAEQALAMKRLPPWHGLEQEQPQKWLERLAELRRQKQTADADELLAEFKRRFPDHPLPGGFE